jgi:hypothetical protein
MRVAARRVFSFPVSGMRVIRGVVNATLMAMSAAVKQRMWPWSGPHWIPRACSRCWWNSGPISELRGNCVGMMHDQRSQLS